MWTDNSYGDYAPRLRRPIEDGSSSFLDSGGGDGSAASPIMAGGDAGGSLYLGPPKKNKFQSFLGGMQGGHGLMGGLAGMSGQGGAIGGIGKLASRFMI